MNKKNKIIYYLILIVLTIVSVIARIKISGFGFFLWIINLAFLLVIFFLSNILLIKHIDKSVFYKILFFVSCITFTIAAIIYPESIYSNGPTYGRAVFGTLHEENSSINFSMLYLIGKILIGISLISSIIEFGIRIIEDKKANNSENNTDKDINIKED